MSALAEAYGLMARCQAIDDGTPGHRTLRLYMTALAAAIEQGDESRLRRGIDIMTPLVEAIEHLDLENAP
jgi:hypothetical protein